MTLIAAKWIWAAGCVAWFIIRYPHQRRSRKTRSFPAPPDSARTDSAEYFFLRAVYRSTDLCRDRSAESFRAMRFNPTLAWLGTAVFAGVARVVLSSCTAISGALGR